MKNEVKWNRLAEVATVTAVLGLFLMWSYSNPPELVIATVRLWICIIGGIGAVVTAVLGLDVITD